MAGVLGLLFIQCSLTIDEEELGGAYLTCAANEKECNVQGVPTCVGLDDSRFGCNRRSCIPCNLPNATARCSPTTGDCVNVSCHPSWEDCNEIAADGCEVPLNNDVENCGACGEPCPELTNAEVACGSGHCYIRRCADGFLNCNGKVFDGCEIDATNTDDCGECGEPCGDVCCDAVCCDTVCQEHECEE